MMQLTMPVQEWTQWDPESADENVLRQAVRTAQMANVGQRKTVLVFP